jgi:Uncharacterized conserved protein (DUF2203)
MKHLTRLFKYIKLILDRREWVKNKKTSRRVIRVSEVAHICQPKNHPYTKEEVLDLLPILTTLCKTYNARRTKIYNDQCYMMKCGAPQNIITEYDNKIGKTMQELFNKIYKLGGKALGSGWVAFDMGMGYYCWRYGEPGLLWFVGYGCDPALFRRPA